MGRDIDDRYAIDEKGKVYDKHPPKKEVKPKRKTLLQEVQRVAKAKGFKSVTDFVNSWIQGGQTFSTLRTHLELEWGITKGGVMVWKALRNYLTIPYSYEDQFWYKYDAIAKAKGFKDSQHMVYIFKKRQLSWNEIAEELGLEKKGSIDVFRRLIRGRVEGNPNAKRQYVRHKHKKSHDKDGISHLKSRIEWREKLAKHGFRSLRDAMWKLKKKRGMTYLERARLFEVSVRDLRYRRRRAGI